MKLRDDVNEYGTPVTVFICDTCGREYTVCPKATNIDDWKNCLAIDCDSYDENRDVDKLFDDPDLEIGIEGIH